MSDQAVTIFRGEFILLRPIAVISSSIVTIISSLLPLIHMNISMHQIIWLFAFLSVSAFLVHGILTHSFNDYIDHYSGTDDKSPAMLSGGSRVIQKEIMSVQTVWHIGKWLTILFLCLAVLCIVFNFYKLVVLLLVGIWAAVSYSLPPLRLSYRPFLGEWLSLFPAIFMLGIAGPWLLLESIPLWAVQNAWINALICMAWVMVHHIPDVKADQEARPIKCTSVVWFFKRFGPNFARVPALIYFSIAGISTYWLETERFGAAIFLISMMLAAIYIVVFMNMTDIKQITSSEKILLLIAIITAIGLGVLV